MHAERCPVCNGRGTLRPEDLGECGYTSSAERQCHGCGGKGWVTVGDYNPQPIDWSTPHIPDWWPGPYTVICCTPWIDLREDLTEKVPWIEDNFH